MVVLHLLLLPGMAFLSEFIPDKETEGLINQLYSWRLGHLGAAITSTFDATESVSTNRWVRPLLTLSELLLIFKFQCYGVGSAFSLLRSA